MWCQVTLTPAFRRQKQVSLGIQGQSDLQSEFPHSKGCVENNKKTRIQSYN